MSDYDAERIAALATEGLTRMRATAEEDGDTNLRLDNFAIVAVCLWDDEDGQEREGVAVWCESKRHYVKQGILQRGLARIEETFA